MIDLGKDRNIKIKVIKKNNEKFMNINQAAAMQT